MTREEQLQFCRICRHKAFNSQQGIICAFTQQPASFEKECSTFEAVKELKVEQEEQNKVRELENSIATKGTRFLNSLIDSICYIIFAVIFVFITSVILAFTSPSLLNALNEGNDLIWQLFVMIISLIYFTVMEATTGRTVGKYITKTMVVTEDGQKPAFGTIFKRSLCRLIPFEAFSFLGSEPTGLHDRISKTLVVKYVKQEDNTYLFK